MEIFELQLFLYIIYLHLNIIIAINNSVEMENINERLLFMMMLQQLLWQKLKMHYQ